MRSGKCFPLEFFISLSNVCQVPSALASRAQSLLRCCSLFREATTEPGREALRKQIVEAASSFRGQTEARRKTKAPPQKMDVKLVAASPIAPADSVSAVPRAAQSAAVISRVLTRMIVQAPRPPASPSAATTAARRSSPELFVSSLLVCPSYLPVRGRRGSVRCLAFGYSSTTAFPSF